jgi:hypothetical protein
VSIAPKPVALPVAIWLLLVIMRNISSEMAHCFWFFSLKCCLRWA